MRNVFGLLALLLLATTHANADGVTKEQWISNMNTALPVLFCKSDWYFMKCFDISKTECEETATSATHVCLKSLQNEFPDTFHGLKDGEFWGTKVGECAGRAYEATLLYKRISNQECNDPNNWDGTK
jgi:hypothetical protein